MKSNWLYWSLGILIVVSSAMILRKIDKIEIPDCPVCPDVVSAPSCCEYQELVDLGQAWINCSGATVSVVENPDAPPDAPLFLVCSRKTQDGKITRTISPIPSGAVSLGADGRPVVDYGAVP